VEQTHLRIYRDRMHKTRPDPTFPLARRGLGLSCPGPLREVVAGLLPGDPPNGHLRRCELLKGNHPSFERASGS
jgi:hypothetical protein